VPVYRRRHRIQDKRRPVFLGELYRFYLDLMVKTVGAYFAIVGGIVTLVLANVKAQPIIAIALVVPIAMSLLLALAGWRIRSKVRELRDALDKLGESLTVTVKPHVEILDWGVSWSSLLLLIASALLAALLWWLASRNGASMTGSFLPMSSYNAAMEERSECRRTPFPGSQPADDLLEVMSLRKPHGLRPAFGLPGKRLRLTEELELWRLSRLELDLTGDSSPVHEPLGRVPAGLEGKARKVRL
jgi:hypothetical protein